MRQKGKDIRGLSFLAEEMCCTYAAYNMPSATKMAIARPPNSALTLLAAFAVLVAAPAAVPVTEVIVVVIALLTEVIVVSMVERVVGATVSVVELSVMVVPELTW